MNSLPLEDLRDNRKKIKVLLEQLYELFGLLGQKTFYKCNVSSASFCWSVNSHRTDRFIFFSSYTPEVCKRRENWQNRYLVLKSHLGPSLGTTTEKLMEIEKLKIQNAPLKTVAWIYQRPHGNIHRVGAKSPQELFPFTKNTFLEPISLLTWVSTWQRVETHF